VAKAELLDGAFSGKKKAFSGEPREDVRKEEQDNFFEKAVREHTCSS